MSRRGFTAERPASGTGRPFLVVAAVAGVTACSSPAPAPRRTAPGTDHVQRGPAGDPGEALAAAVAAGEPVAIVRAAGLVAAAGGDLAPHRPAIWSAIDRADAVQLEALVHALGAREPAGAVRVRLALVAAHRGDAAAAATHLAAARGAPDLALPAIAARAKIAAVPEPAPDPAVIAFLAPTSGPRAGIGRELVAAAKLAVDRSTKLVVVDTKGTEDGARAAVDSAVAKGAIAIVGPVGERESLAAARQASALGIPIGLLAPSDGADPAAGVFRLVSSANDEARMAAWVAAELAFPTVGVLAPRDDVGAAAAAAFVEAAKAKGLTVTAHGDYDPSAGKLEPDVKAFLGLDPMRNERLRAHLRRHGKKGWQTFSPDVPFAFLYIPDRYDRAALVAAFLPYFGVELRTQEFPDPEMLRRKHRGRIPQVVQLAGDSGWNDPRLIIRGGTPVEGSLIIGVFGGELDPGVGGEFAVRFRSSTGRAASAAAAQTHDAVRLVMAARDAAARTRGRGRQLWVAMAKSMTGIRIEDGACGPAMIEVATGEVLRDAIVLQVDAGEIVMAP